jgi:hypothetical protein
MAELSALWAVLLALALVATLSVIQMVGFHSMERSLCRKFSGLTDVNSSAILEALAAFM